MSEKMTLIDQDAKATVVTVPIVVQLKSMEGERGPQGEPGIPPEELTLLLSQIRALQTQVVSLQTQIENIPPPDGSLKWSNGQVLFDGTNIYYPEGDILGSSNYIGYPGYQGVLSNGGELATPLPIFDGAGNIPTAGYVFVGNYGIGGGYQLWLKPGSFPQWWTDSNNNPPALGSVLVGQGVTALWTPPGSQGVINGMSVAYNATPYSMNLPVNGQYLLLITANHQAVDATASVTIVATYTIDLVVQTLTFGPFPVTTIGDTGFSQCIQTDATTTLTITATVTGATNPLTTLSVYAKLLG